MADELCQGFTQTQWDKVERRWVRDPRPCKNKATMKFYETPVCGKHYRSMEATELKVGFLALIIEAKSKPKESTEYPLSERQVAELARAIAPLVKGNALGG